MTKAALIQACEAGHVEHAMKYVIDEAKALLVGWSAPQIAYSPNLQPVEHFRRIYQRRLEHFIASRQTPSGLQETVDAFARLPDGTELRCVAVEDQTQPLFFWLDVNGAVVASVIG